jgi:hypothetical protein
MPEDSHVWLKQVITNIKVNVLNVICYVLFDAKKREHQQ